MATTPTVVSADQSKNLTLKFRKGEGKPFAFHVLEDSSAYDISALTFVFEVYDIDGDLIFQLTEDSGGGLTNNGATGILEVDPSDDNLGIDEKSYHWKLRVTAPTVSKQTWFNGLFIINNSPQEDTDDDSATVNLDLGDIVVEVNLTITGFDLASMTEEQKYQLWLSIEKYATGQTP